MYYNNYNIYSSLFTTMLYIMIYFSLYDILTIIDCHVIKSTAVCPKPFLQFGILHLHFDHVT